MLKCLTLCIKIEKKDAREFVFPFKQNILLYQKRDTSCGTHAEAIDLPRRFIPNF